MGTTFAAIFIALALLSVGVVYGTDVFFTVIGRRALARSTDQSIADVMGHLHEIGDTRMPLFGALGLLATAASALTSGVRQPAGWLAAIAFLSLLGHLALYLSRSKPINAILTDAARAGQAPANTRSLQAQWDRVVGVRAVLLLIAFTALILAALLH